MRGEFYLARCHRCEVRLEVAEVMTPGEAEDSEEREEKWRPGRELRGRDVQIEAGPGLVTQDQTQEEEESQADGGGHGPPKPEEGILKVLIKTIYSNDQ